MYNYSNYPCNNYRNAPWYTPEMYPYFYALGRPDYMWEYPVRNTDYSGMAIKDYGPNPFAINIDEASKQNNNFRTALWTGDHMQLTLMSLAPGEDIGMEIHPNVDQFIRIEEGQGTVRMGKDKNADEYVVNVDDDYAFIVPANTWHNVVNTGSTPMKLYSIYAPPRHPHGTIQRTKADANAAE
ncbi:MAG TPA: cupin domain-containing protein [Clostridiales bacterium]|nr:cupin domain-containing protein [Clostridiales bacterium]